MRNPKRVMANQVLCAGVWGHDWQATANDLKALGHRLRAKLDEDPRRPHYIETQRGRGYCLLVGHSPGRQRTPQTIGL